MKSESTHAWHLARAIQMYPAHPGQDPAYVVPHLMPKAGTTLIRHPRDMDARWLAAHIALQISRGGELAPFPPARKTMTRLLTSMREGYGTNKLLRILARPQRWAADDEWLNVTFMRGRKPVGDDAVFDMRDLSDPNLAFGEALVIDDVRLLLPAAARGLSDPRPLQALFNVFARLNRAGIAVLAFLPQDKDEPMHEAHAILVDPIEIQLKEDPGGIKESGTSLLVHRRKTSPLDPHLTFFRWYFVIPKAGSSKPTESTPSEDEDLSSEHAVGFDVPRLSEAEQERKDDRQAQIEYLRDVEKLIPAAIAEKLGLHPSTVSRRLRKA